MACASSEAKLDRLRSLGADHVVNYDDARFLDAVRARFGKPRITGGGGVDLAVNFTGGDTWTDTQKCAALGGRIVTCGATAGYQLTTDARYLWTFEHTMIGSNGWSPDDLTRLMTLIAGATWRRDRSDPAARRGPRRRAAARGARSLREDPLPALIAAAPFVGPGFGRPGGSARRLPRRPARVRLFLPLSRHLKTRGGRAGVASAHPTGVRQCRLDRWPCSRWS